MVTTRAAARRAANVNSGNLQSRANNTKKGRFRGGRQPRGGSHGGCRPPLSTSHSSSGDEPPASDNENVRPYVEGTRRGTAHRAHQRPSSSSQSFSDDEHSLDSIARNGVNNHIQCLYLRSGGPPLRRSGSWPLSMSECDVFNYDNRSRERIGLPNESRIRGQVAWIVVSAIYYFLRIKYCIVPCCRFAKNSTSSHVPNPNWKPKLFSLRQPIKYILAFSLAILLLGYQAFTIYTNI